MSFFGRGKISDKLVIGKTLKIRDFPGCRIYKERQFLFFEKKVLTTEVFNWSLSRLFCINVFLSQDKKKVPLLQVVQLSTS